MNIISIKNFVETKDGLTARITYETKNIFGSRVLNQRTIFIKRFGSIYYKPMWAHNLKGVSDDLKELVVHQFNLYKTKELLKK